MVTKKSPSNVMPPTGDTLHPRRSVRAVVTRKTAPSVVANAAAGAATPTPHASAVAPPLLKPSAGKKSAKDAVPTEEETPTAPTGVAAAAAGAAAPIPHASAVATPLSKPSGAGKKSAEDAEPVKEETTTALTAVAVAAAGKAAGKKTA